jgi:hypothetical protein
MIEPVAEAHTDQQLPRPAEIRPAGEKLMPRTTFSMTV